MNEKRSSARIEADKVLLELENKNEKELRKILDELYEEEQEISYRRRLLHGKIDIIREELVQRLGDKHKKGKGIIGQEDIGKLTDILSKVLSDDDEKKSVK